MDAPDLGPRYQPLYRLAAGGMAEVWVGAQKVAAAHRPVAIKRILPQYAEEEKYVRMFLDEAHLAACIDSPNVVALIDADVAADGAPFLVMELVEGLPLSTLLRSKPPMDQGTVCFVIKEAALGLHDAHEARAATGELLQLVHRDVSPQNLLLGVDGRVRLADFGVAHALERMTLTVGGEFKGKLAYCAPEQIRGMADRRADIFSLGVVIRQALSGQKLFGKSSGNAETLHKLLHEEIRPTRLVAPHIDDKLAAVIDKALCRDPNGRYPNAAAFADALTPFVRASRVSLGELVKAAGGDDLKKRRDKTTEIFTALKAGNSTAALTSTPAHSSAARSKTARPAVASAHAPPTATSRFWPTTLVLTGAAAIGVVVALNLGDKPSLYETTAAGPVTDTLDGPPDEPLVEVTAAPALPVQELATQEAAAEPLDLEAVDLETTPSETSPDPETVESTRRSNRPHRPRSTTAATNEDTDDGSLPDEPAVAVSPTDRAQHEALHEEALHEEAVEEEAVEEEAVEEEAVEEDPTTMGRARRLRRDVF